MFSSNDLPDFSRARKTYLATRSLGFANIPAVDLKDRLSVLTVAAGLRPIGVLETWGQRLAKTRDAMIALGFPTSTATCVWSTIDRPSDTSFRAVLHALDERRVAGKPRHVLWFYSDPSHRDEFRQNTYTQQKAAELLGYPPCCIGFEAAIMGKLPSLQLQELIAQHGSDEATLLRQIKRTKTLPSPKFPLPDNALRTEQTLPFVLHVACDSCLQNPHSPSSLLNDRYADLVRCTDGDLYNLFLKVRDSYLGIGSNHGKNREILLEISFLHSRLFGQPTR